MKGPRPLLRCGRTGDDTMAVPSADLCVHINTHNIKQANVVTLEIREMCNDIHMALSQDFSI